MRTIRLTGTLVLLTAGSAVAQPPQPPATSYLSPEPVTIPTGALTETRPFDMTGPRFWATGDYLLMWYTPMRTVPLVQAVPAAQANTSSGAGGVTIFPRNNRINFDALSGISARVGANWEKFGLDVGGFALERENRSYSIFNAGTPFAIAQGYVAAGSGANTSLFASLPNQYSGGVVVVAQSRLYGFDGNVRRAWYSFLSDSTDLLVGVKYLDLQESLAIDSPSVFPSGGIVDVRDSIRTRNTFYGGYVGFNSRWGGDEPGFGLDITTKSGVGGVGQRVELVGFNGSIPAGGPADIQAGGLYARALNTGTFTRTRLAYSQDLDVRLTYNFSRWVQVSFGYSLTYLSSAVRAGRQIDGVVNDSNARFVAMPTPSTQARPSFLWRAEEFTVQGMTFGLRVQY